MMKEIYIWYITNNNNSYDITYKFIYINYVMLICDTIYKINLKYYFKLIFENIYI